MEEVSKKRERTDDDKELMIQQLETENEQLEKSIKKLNEDHKNSVRSIRRTNSDGECRKCWKAMWKCHCSSFSSDDE